MSNLDNQKERIAKYISASGICSRRQAERMITENKVMVNNQIISHPAFLVSDDDEITVDGKKIKKISEKETRLWIYNKPRGIIVTHDDEKGRETIFDLLPKEIGHVVSVGRLDLNSEGLILLTNNKTLKTYLESPENGFIRKYRVRVFGNLPKDKFANLKNGITIDGIFYKSVLVEIEKDDINSWLIVSLLEGKNREIRKIMSFFGLEVSRLIRISYGDFELGDLKIGDLIEIPVTS